MLKLNNILKGLCDLVAACLLLLTLALPTKLRKKVLRLTAPLSYGLILRMLLPASIRETQTQPLWITPLKPDSTEMILAFGGNNETMVEMIKLFQGIPLQENVFFETSQRPTLVFPLATAYSQNEYITQIEQWIIQSTQGVDSTNITKIQAIGHSLGGAILVQVTPYLQKRFPNAQIFLTLDRTFSTLSAAAKSEYGFGGILLEKTLGLLWQFDSVSQLSLLAQSSNIFVKVIQVDPDHVLGKALLSQAIRGLPRGDWMIYHLTRSHENTLHAAPFTDLHIETR